MPKSPKKPPAAKKTPKPKPKSTDRTDYEAHKDRAAKRSTQQSGKGRDIAPIPDIVDIARREECRWSLRRFCEVYNSVACRLAWSKSHLKAIDRIEEAILTGNLFALAMPRGEGKTTICRNAAVWAIAYNHLRYVLLIAATGPKADKSLDSIKKRILSAPFCEDFPEISWPIKRLKNLAHNAAGQTCNGETTWIESKTSQMVLATVPPPENWPEDWKIIDGMVPTSGSVIGTSGLTAEGIRGSVFTTNRGDEVRPDFVLLDDPQTPESAVSPDQCDKREELIVADVLGMAGPDITIAGVMACTVICEGDLSHRMLDRDKNPLWAGEKTKMLVTMPTNMEAWDNYFEVYSKCSQLYPRDFTASTAYYEDNREILDAGAEPSWNERIAKPAVSAIQNAMHLYARNRRVFFSEYQNEPMPPDSRQLGELKPDEIIKNVGLPRGSVPMGSTVTAGIDLNKALLTWVVVAWREGFSGQILGYGTFPEQSRDWFTWDGARPKLENLIPNMNDEDMLFAGLQRLLPKLFTFSPLRIVIDAGWKPDVTYKTCSRDNRKLTPSRGAAIGPNSKPMSERPLENGQPHGFNWRMHRDHFTDENERRPVYWAEFDSSQWKTLIAGRLATGEIKLFQPEGDRTHRLFASHLCSEFRPLIPGNQGRQVEQWILKPGDPDNHYWDALIMSAVGASIHGCPLVIGEVEDRKPPEPKARKSALDAYNKAGGGAPSQRDKKIGAMFGFDRGM